MCYFVFNINKCTGCQACTVACSIENKTELPVLWRNVNIFNNFKHPEIPVFHLSISCNHCEDAICMKSCPANAFYRDIVTGAVIQNPSKCIGCKYCTWACPYDAPKFNNVTKIVEKCNFCNHRIEKGLKPACANLCPTGALSFDFNKSTIENEHINGFPQIGISPSIKIIPLRNDEPPKMSLKQENKDLIWNITKNINTDKKISAKKEVPLIVFTILTSLLSAFFISPIFEGYAIDKIMFFEIGVIALIFSSLHLGKKIRAFRAILNIKSSWLSREILFFTSFLILAALNLFVFNENLIISYLTALLGFTTLFSIDMIYKVGKSKNNLFFNSSDTFFTGILFWGILTANSAIFITIGLLKAILYTIRNFNELRTFSFTKSNFIKALRLDLLISFPLIFWLLNIDNLFLLIAISVFIGEIIDRIEFYNEIEILTPEIQIKKDLTNLV